MELYCSNKYITGAIIEQYICFYVIKRNGLFVPLAKIQTLPPPPPITCEPILSDDSLILN